MQDAKASTNSKIRPKDSTLKYTKRLLATFRERANRTKKLMNHKARLRAKRPHLMRHLCTGPYRQIQHSKPFLKRHNKNSIRPEKIKNSASKRNGKIPKIHPIMCYRMSSKSNCMSAKREFTTRTNRTLPATTKSAAPSMTISPT